MNKELVSVITPCYNGAKYIGETIESVLSQTYKDWEMIIVDDGSSDNSADIIAEYAEKDSRIKYVRQKNSGSAAARNTGIKTAEGQYIALLDADDLWDRDFLSEQIAFMNEKKSSLVCCAYRKIDERSGEILRPTYPKKIITARDMKVMNRIGCLTGLYDCSKYGKVYLHEELKSLRDDYAYFSDIISLCGKAYGNQKVLCSYRVSSSSLTGNKKKLIGKQYRFYREYLKESPAEAAVNTLRWGLSGIFKYGIQY